MTSSGGHLRVGEERLALEEYMDLVSRPLTTLTRIMGLRMHKARWALDTDVLIKAWEYDHERHAGKVVCDLCRCPVSGVVAAGRKIGDFQIKIRPYYRLPVNAEKEGRGHTPTCRYNT